MSIKKPLLYGLLLAVTVLFSTTSCKKCSVAEEDQNTGIIVPNAIVYCLSGYLTTELNGNYHITGSHTYANNFEVSFDGGITRQAVDYGTYDVLALPMTVNCEASFNRDVSINEGASTTTYAVTATTCASCEQQYLIENYVLVPNLPAYIIEYDPETITQN